MKRLITENASKEAFLPMASIRKTATIEPKRVPMHNRLLIQVALFRDGMGNFGNGKGYPKLGDHQYQGLVKGAILYFRNLYFYF